MAAADPLRFFGDAQRGPVRMSLALEGEHVAIDLTLEFIGNSFDDIRILRTHKLSAQFAKAIVGCHTVTIDDFP